MFVFEDLKHLEYKNRFLCRIEEVGRRGKSRVTNMISHGKTDSNKTEFVV